VNNLEVSVRVGNWQSFKADAMPIREAVFVAEQGVPLDEEVDDMDELCLHAVAYDSQNKAIATGRLLPDGHIGRMAVHLYARKKHVGSAVLSTLVSEARKRGHPMVILHAQVHATNFYVRHGFVAEGGEFLEADIPHVKMTMRLDA
jgi:predicted GNAT family N-acyltransferase